jgi:hypothetical protein
MRKARTCPAFRSSTVALELALAAQDARYPFRARLRIIVARMAMLIWIQLRAQRPWWRLRKIVEEIVINRRGGGCSVGHCVKELGPEFEPPPLLLLLLLARESENIEGGTIPKELRAQFTGSRHELGVEHAVAKWDPQPCESDQNPTTMRATRASRAIKIRIWGRN